MPQFLYHVPGAGVMNPAQDPAFLPALGLDSLFRVTDPFHALPGQGGPGGDGLLFGFGREGFGEGNRRLAYKPKEQEWEEADGYSVGVWKDWRPSPNDLVRPEPDQVAGRAVRLADGLDWIIPVARLWFVDDDKPAWDTCLESTLRLTKAGTVETGDVVPRLARLWDEAQELAEIVFGTAADSGDQARVQLEDDFRRCIFFLGVNYRVGRPEVNLLKLLSDNDRGGIAQIVKTVVDLDGFNLLGEQLPKKAVGAGAQ